MSLNQTNNIRMDTLISYHRNPISNSYLLPHTILFNQKISLLPKYQDIVLKNWNVQNVY